MHRESRGKAVIKPKVSIIVPVYNTELYLEQCVDSIRNQTVKDIEIILIDDGSTDGCPVMCDRFAGEDERIRVFHQNNLGVSVARNRGIDAASADWIMFVDSDDWLERNAVELLYEKVTVSGCNMICASLYKNYPGGQKAYKLNFGEVGVHPVENNLKYLFDRTFAFSSGMISLMSSCGKLYRANNIVENQCYFPAGLKHREDVIFNLYAGLYTEKICVLNYPIYHYRQRSDSVTHTFHGDEQEMYCRYNMEVYLFMEKFQLTEEFRSSYHCAVLEGIFYVAKLYGANAHSWSSLQKAALLLKQFSEETECAKAIDAVQITSMQQKKRKVILWLLKQHMYWMIILISSLYQLPLPIKLF